jgi:hypothetical protein
MARLGDRIMFGSLFKIVKKNPTTDSTADTQRVNCQNLVFGTTQVPRLHCDMGDGRSGDCLIYLKKAEKCSFHNPKYMVMSKEDIKEKVSKIAEDREYRENCLYARICPDCGHELVIDDWDESEFTDGICNICQKTYILD